VDPTIASRAMLSKLMNRSSAVLRKAHGPVAKELSRMDGKKSHL